MNVLKTQQKSKQSKICNERQDEFWRRKNRLVPKILIPKILAPKRTEPETCLIRAKDRNLGRGYLTNIDKYVNSPRMWWTHEQRLQHLIREIEQYEPNLVVFLQATSPLRNPGDIDAAIMKLINCSADSCFSSYKQHFMARWSVNDDGIASPINMKLSNRPTRQEVPIQYLENGNIYVFKPWVLAAGDRLGGKIITYAMNILDSIQIDSPKDFQPCEQILKIRNR